MTTGELIKMKRKELDLTLEDVGDFCNVPKSTVLRWERGDIQKIKRDKMALLCKILNINPLILLRPQEIITDEEYEILEAFRKADDRARQDALKTLLDHPAIKKESRMAM